jgi:chorismate dehydratase
MKVALVEFLNAYPLYYALKENIIENSFEFLSKPPSICAELLRSSKVDIGNVPIIEYANSKNYKIIKDCCISSNKEVKSVVLFLKKPISQVKVVKLDKNSNTSVALTKVLFAFKYKLSVDYVYDSDADCELVIGDRALKRIKQDNYTKLDLAVEWNDMTSLPFVFAAWLTNCNLSEDMQNLFIESKEWGKKHIKNICESFTNSKDLVNNDECQSYLTNNISYDLTEEKIESIEQFFYYANKCNIIPHAPKIRFSC